MCRLSVQGARALQGGQSGTLARERWPEFMVGRKDGERRGEAALRSGPRRHPAGGPRIRPAREDQSRLRCGSWIFSGIQAGHSGPGLQQRGRSNRTAATGPQIRDGECGKLTGGDRRKPIFLRLQTPFQCAAVPPARSGAPPGMTKTSLPDLRLDASETASFPERSFPDLHWLGAIPDQVVAHLPKRLLVDKCEVDSPYARERVTRLSLIGVEMRSEDITEELKRINADWRSQAKAAFR